MPCAMEIGHLPKKASGRRKTEDACHASQHAMCLRGESEGLVATWHQPRRYPHPLPLYAVEPENAPSPQKQLFQLFAQAILGQEQAFEPGCEGHGRVEAGHPHDGRVEPGEARFGDACGQLGAEAARARVFVQHEHPVGLAHRGEDGFGVEWHECAQVNDFPLEI